MGLRISYHHGSYDFDFPNAYVQVQPPAMASKTTISTMFYIFATEGAKVKGKDPIGQGQATVTVLGSMTFAEGYAALWAELKLQQTFSAGVDVNP